VDQEILAPVEPVEPAEEHDNKLETVTLVVPFYRNSGMLKRQLREWEYYPSGVKVIVVDDGSPEAAKPIIEAAASEALRERLELYRILVDIPWNREGARNLGAHHVSSRWLIHVDIDHVLPASGAVELLEFEPNAKNWYRFPRWRKGRADETRKKDQIPDALDFGQIHPHIDSYLITKSLYWDTGGYDEDYSGCLGGGNAFLRRLEERAGPPRLLPEKIPLHVYTRTEISDASDWSLSRDTTEGKKRWKVKTASKNTRPKNPMRFKWERVL
jgi:hypothetical protein